MKKNFKCFLKEAESDFCALGFSLNDIEKFVKDRKLDINQLCQIIENEVEKSHNFALYFLTTTVACKLYKTNNSKFDIVLNYSMLAVKKYPPAINAIGFFYMHGIFDVEQKLEKAILYFRQAMKAGFLPAQCNLAELYFSQFNRYGIVDFRTSAEMLYNSAIAKGFKKAKFYYAFSLLDILDVPKSDKEKAYSLLDEALRDGVNAAILLVNRCPKLQADIDNFKKVSETNLVTQEPNRGAEISRGDLRRVTTISPPSSPTQFEFEL